MRTKHILAEIFFSISLIGLTGCLIPRNLVKPEDVDSYPYGSVIYVRTIKNITIAGELLAVDSNYLLVLPDKTLLEDAALIRKDQIKSYIVFFAQPKNYNYTIPMSLAVTATHGWFMPITLPLNVIVSSLTSRNAARAFSYRSQDITYDQLKIYSRYPEGLPQELTNTRFNEFKKSVKQN